MHAATCIAYDSVGPAGVCNALSGECECAPLPRDGNESPSSARSQAKKLASVAPALAGTMSRSEEIGSWKESERMFR